MGIYMNGGGWFFVGEKLGNLRVYAVSYGPLKTPERLYYLAKS